MLSTSELAPACPWIALAVGLIVGSFANVCIHRLPLGESVVHPPSRCPGCGALIRPWDNVPVLSYLVLRGRCRRCAARISPRYPLVELANGLLYWAAAAQLGCTPRAVVTMALLTALLVLALIDLEHKILPDRITLPGVIAGLAASGLPDWPVAPLDAAGAAAAGYLAFFALAESYRRVRGIEALGQGDWKMAAMLGAFLGWKGLLLTVMLASLSGTLVGVSLMIFRGRTAQHMLPFGTFLALGAMAALFVGQPLVAWYGGLFGG